MSTGTEDFDQLRKLLKLKNHEKPPPGYFDHLAGRVMQRLERGKTAGGFGLNLSWWVRLRRVLAANPISAVILAACSVLIVFAANYQFGEAEAPLNANLPAADDLAGKGGNSGGLSIAFASGQEHLASASNTVDGTENAFNSFPSLKAQPVSFTFSPQ